MTYRPRLSDLALAGIVFLQVLVLSQFNAPSVPFCIGVIVFSFAVHLHGVLEGAARARKDKDA